MLYSFSQYSFFPSKSMVYFSSYLCHLWFLSSVFYGFLFFVALFTIARTWKQPKCPLVGEWIRKLRYIHTMEYYSAIKRNTFESVLMRWINLELIIQNEVSQKEKDTCTPMFIATLFTIVRIWKQPRCPLTDELIKKLWYIYTMEYYSAIKRNTFESILMR